MFWSFKPHYNVILNPQMVPYILVSDWFDCFYYKPGLQWSRQLLEKLNAFQTGVFIYFR